MRLANKATLRYWEFETDFQVFFNWGYICLRTSWKAVKDRMTLQQQGGSGDQWTEPVRKNKVNIVQEFLTSSAIFKAGNK